MVCLRNSRRVVVPRCGMKPPLSGSKFWSLSPNPRTPPLTQQHVHSKESDPASARDSFHTNQLPAIAFAAKERRRRSPIFSLRRKAATDVSAILHGAHAIRQIIPAPCKYAAFLSCVIIPVKPLARECLRTRESIHRIQIFVFDLVAGDRKLF